MQTHWGNTELRHAQRILIEEVLGMITGDRSHGVKILRYSEYFSIDHQSFLTSMIYGKNNFYRQK